jgi:hypothetical protein
VNEFLKERILRRLESLPEERVYQVLDYVEFLESKYSARKPAEPNVVQRFAEGVQDTLRAGNVSAKAISETMGYMSKAMGVLAGAKAAAESVASDVTGVVKKAVEAGKAATPVPPGAANPTSQSPSPKPPSGPPTSDPVSEG